MNEEKHPDQRSPLFSFVTYPITLVAIVIFIGFAFMPRLGSTKVPRQNITQCKNNIKQLGLHIQSYYSDGVSTAMPILKSFEVSATNDGGFGFDAHMLQCAATRHDHSIHYVWNPKLSGGNWAEWNNPHSPLIWDATPHKVNGKVNVLFGDGYVGQLTPEELQVRTR